MVMDITKEKQRKCKEKLRRRWMAVDWLSRCVRVMLLGKDQEDVQERDEMVA